MLLTIDVGNSNVVVAVYDNQKQRVFQQRFVTVKENVSEFYRNWVRQDLLPLSRKNRIDCLLYRKCRSGDHSGNNRDH